MSGTNVTDADVASAESEAQEAADLVAALEAAVMDGDETVTPDQIVAQESLSRFAKLRAEATRRKAEKSRIAIRLNAAESLHEEIDEYAQGIGPKLAKLLRKVGEAEAAFLSTANEHDRKIWEWRTRANNLGIPESDGRPMPPAEDGRVALGRANMGIHAGRRHLTVIAAKNLLERHREVGTEDQEAIYAHLEKIDAEAAASTAKHFYRGPGGAVIGHDNPFSSDEVKRMSLVKLSRKEALGE